MTFDFSFSSYHPKTNMIAERILIKRNTLEKKSPNSKMWVALVSFSYALFLWFQNLNASSHFYTLINLSQFHHHHPRGSRWMFIFFFFFVPFSLVQMDDII